MKLYNSKPNLFYISLFLIGSVIFILGIQVHPPYQDLLINISASFLFSIISIFLIDKYNIEQEKLKKSRLEKTYLSALFTLSCQLIHSLRDFYNIKYKDIQASFDTVVNDDLKIMNANKVLLSEMISLNSNSLILYTPDKLVVLQSNFKRIRIALESFLNRYSSLGLISREVQEVLIDLLERKTRLDFLEIFPELLSTSVLVNNKGKNIAPMMITSVNESIGIYLSEMLKLTDQLIKEYKDNNQYLET